MVATLTIDHHAIESRAGASILEAARAAGLYIPTLCSHPDLPVGRGTRPSDTVYRGAATWMDTSGHEAFGGCQLCLVEVDGALVHACDTPARAGLVVKTDSVQVRQGRQDNLARILATHPHACLVCPNREGCDRLQCSLNVPPQERCCSKFAYCEVRKVSDYIGIKPDTPRYVYQNLPNLRDEPLFTRDFNLCIGCTRCVRICADVRGVGALGFVNTNGRVIVGSLASTLPESACKFCTACVEVCPTGALMDKKPVVRGRTVAPLVTPRQAQGGLSGERTHALVPCRAACPIMTDVPRYVRLVAEGKYAEAAAVVRERAPFPGVLGYICFHPCEDACRRGQVNEAIGICALKRFAADHANDLWKQNLGRPKPTGKRVAIVGSGPAGLTAAYFLARRGHAVTVFEAASEPGGMMRYGIPRYRLPRQVLDREIAEIVAQGVEMRTNTRIGNETSIDALRREYDALFLAVGASLSKKIPLEGSELEGVLWGLDFLRGAAQNSALATRHASLGRVMVIGGGNVAIDVAMTARRLGARDVQMACLEKREEMPAFDNEIAAAEAEGIHIHTSWGPRKIGGSDGRVTGIELKRCTAVFDEDRRFNPRYDEAVTTSFECDTVILAIGQSTDLTILDGAVEARGALIRADEATLATNVPGIFAGGEVAVGPSSVVQSIAAGRRAALAIDQSLGGAGDIDERLVDGGYGTPRLGRDDDFAQRQREPMPTLPLADRLTGFALIDSGYEQAQARREAARCLQCDLRLTISAPVLPPEGWLAFVAEKIAAVPEADGVYQLLDADKNIVKIVGVQNLRRALEDQLASNPKAQYFVFEEERMYTQRESELLQQYLQQHGKLPEGNDELADLF